MKKDSKNLMTVLLGDLKNGIRAHFADSAIKNSALKEETFLLSANGVVHYHRKWIFEKSNDGCDEIKQHTILISRTKLEEIMLHSAITVFKLPNTEHQKWEHVDPVWSDLNFNHKSDAAPIFTSTLKQVIKKDSVTAE